MEWARKLMPLRRWAALVLALGLLMAWGVHEMQDTVESGLSSVASSSASSIVGDPPPVLAVPPPGASEAHPLGWDPQRLASQVCDLAASHRAMMGEISETRAAERARELRRGALDASAQSSGRSAVEANQQ
eukprot:1944291-Pyramimonas_sp.AAC.1